MKHLKHMLAATLAVFLAFVLAVPAFAAGTPGITIKPNNDEESTESVAITYTYYKILEADIDTDPTVSLDGAATVDGKVSYYVTTKAKADALSGTNLFTVTKVAGQDKWYVELTNKNTTADAIATAFNNETFLSNFTEQSYTKPNGTPDAVLPDITAGYYFIKSSLGTKLAVQTLSPVTINEKNSYPGITKTHATATDALAGIGDTISYTITLEIPESVAEKDIKIVDTISDGLTLNTVATVTGAVADPAYTSATFVAGEPAGTYTITVPAATVIANKGKTLTFTYTATVNENAVVLEPETNTAHLEYDNFVSKDVDVVTTKTLAYDIQKVDGTNKNTILTGAEFSLWSAATGGDQINLIDITAEGATTKKYRVATAAEAAADGFESAAIEAGTARIEGLNDAKYYLQEDKAPTSYNKLNGRTEITVTEATSTTDIDNKIENNKGTQLPSTGGMGTTILYIVGGILVVGGCVALVTKRRMASIEK